MSFRMTPRTGNLLIFISCSALLGFALYKQHVDYVDPCPLCVFQRLAFLWMGGFALLAALHNPARTGQRVYAALVVVGALFGALIAGRHIWMQYLPADQVPRVWSPVSTTCLKISHLAKRLHRYSRVPAVVRSRNGPGWV